MQTLLLFYGSWGKPARCHNWRSSSTGQAPETASLNSGIWCVSHNKELPLPSQALGTHVPRRYFPQPSCRSPASSLCLGLSGLDSLTDDPSCHQSQYWMHRDNTGNSLLCGDRHLWSICETILAKEDRQLYFVPNIAWQVWTHPGITPVSSRLEGQESTFDRENRLWHSDRKMKTQQHPEKESKKPL